MIEVRGLDRVIEKVERLRNLRPALRATVERETSALQAHVVGEKLSGQVLHVRTGTLRRSITAHVEEDAQSVTGIVGTNVRYARIQEYGGTIQHPGSVARTARALHWQRDGVDVFARRTRPHAIRIPERSYLRSALAERRPAILTAVSETIRKVAEG